MERQLVVRVAGLVVILAAAVMGAEPEIDVKGYRVKVQNDRIVLIGEERDRGVAFVYAPRAGKPVRLESVRVPNGGILDVQVLPSGHILTNDVGDTTRSLAVFRNPEGKEIWRCGYGSTEYAEGHMVMALSGAYGLVTGWHEFLLVDGKTGRPLVVQKEDEPFSAAFTSTDDIVVVSNGCARLLRTAGIAERARSAPVPLDSMPGKTERLAAPDGSLLGPAGQWLTEWFYASPTGGRFCAKLLPLRGASRYDACHFVVIDTALNVWIMHPDSAVLPQVRNVNVVSDRHILLTANCRTLILDAQTRSVVGRLDGLACEIWQAMERDGRITFVRMDDEKWEPQRKAGVFKSWQEADWAVPIIFDTYAKTFRTSDTVNYGVVGRTTVVRRCNSTKLTLREES